MASTILHKRNPFILVFLACCSLFGVAHAQLDSGYLMVFQVNGTTSAAASVTIAEYSPTLLMQASPVTFVNLPSALPPYLTVSGSASSEGHMSLDSERTHLIVAGYNAAAGTASVNSSAGINRVIFSIDPNGGSVNVADVSQTNCFKTNNIRSATAAGSRYFGCGNGSGGTGGVQLMGGSTNTQVSSTINSTRDAAIYNGQLYFSSNTPAGIYMVGSGIPSASGTPSTALAGITNGSPFDFAMSPDNNTLYVADDAAGILKYTRTGGAGSFSGPTTVSSIACRGLTVDFSTTPYTIYATTAFTTLPNALIHLVDGSATADTLALAASGKFFKGLAFTPSSYAKIQLIGQATICSGSSDTLRFWANPGDSVTYTLNGVANGVRLNNTGMMNFNTGALTALNNDSVYAFALVDVTTSLGTKPIAGTVSITVNPSAPAPIVGAGSICNGSALTLTDITASGSWSTTSAAATVSATGQVTGTNAGPAIITYSLSNACGVISDTALVTVNAIPSVNITPGSAAICNGSNTTLAATGATTYSWSPSTALNATTGATVTTSTNSGITYTVTGTTLGCHGTATQSITVNAVPVVTVTPTTATICNGFSTSIAATGATFFSWAPSTGLSTTAGSPVNCSATTTTTYTVSGTTNGCTGTAVQTITVNPIPVLTVTPGSSAICNGANTTITVSGASSYSWSPATGLSATTGSLVTSNTTSGITYTVTGTALGCNGTATQAITVNPIPVLTITPTSASICNGSGTSISAFGANFYSWAPSTGLSATLGSPVNCNATTTTTYTVTGTTLGCVGTATQTITVNPLPVLTVTPGSAAICNGANTTISAAGATTYTWSPLTGLSATTGALVTSNPSATTIYTVSGTTNGCTGTALRTITVNAIPTLTVTPVSPAYCFGSNTSITATGATTYTWLPSTGLSATTGSTVNSSATSTTVYTVSGTTLGCTGTTTRTITVNPIPVPTITPVSSVFCNGSNTDMAATGATTYTWAPSTALNTTTGSTVNSSAASTITYTVSGTTAGCTGTATQLITVHAIPVPTVTAGSSTICFGANTSITATGASTFTWAPATGLSATTGAVVTCSVTATTTYTVSGTTTGCTGSSTKTITVTPLPLAGTVTGTNTVCAGSSVTLSDTAPAGSWISSAPGTATVNSAGQVTGIVAGNAIITYSVTNGCGTVTDTEIVMVNPLPSAGTVSGGTSVCAGSALSLSSTVFGGSWSSTNHPVATIGTNGVVNGLVAGSTTIAYAVSNNCGTAIDSFTFFVNPLPHAGTISGVTTLCPGGVVTLTDLFAGGLWSENNGHVSVAGGVVQGISTGVDTVNYTVTNVCGTDVTTKVVTVNPVENATLSVSVSPDSIICLGSTVTFSANITNGGPSPFIEWKKGNTVVATGGTFSYAPINGDAITSEIVSNAFCVLNDTVHGNTITMNVGSGVTPGATITASTGDTVVAPGRTITFTTSLSFCGPSPIFQWFLNGTAVPGANGPTYTRVVSNNDTIFCVVSCDYACTSTPFNRTNTIVVHTGKVNIVSLNAGGSISLYPNPNNGTFRLHIASDPADITGIAVTNLLGEKVWELQAPATDNMEISLDQPGGLYLVNVTTRDGKWVSKIMVTR